jgi:hypothetical protein
MPPEDGTLANPFRSVAQIIEVVTKARKRIIQTVYVQKFFCESSRIVTGPSFTSSTFISA